MPQAPKTYEVRYVKNKEISQFNKFLKVVLPNSYCMDEKQKEGAKEAIGAGLATTTAINPVVGGVASGVSAVVGATMEGIGKMTDKKDLEDAGNTYKEAPIQPVKEVKKALEE